MRSAKLYTGVSVERFQRLQIARTGARDEDVGDGERDGHLLKPKMHRVRNTSRNDVAGRRHETSSRDAVP